MENKSNLSLEIVDIVYKVIVKVKTVEIVEIILCIIIIKYQVKFLIEQIQKKKKDIKMNIK